MSALGQATSANLSGTTLPAPRVEVAPGSGASPASPADWFEGVYKSAAGDHASVPWAALRPNPMMVSWLNAEAPGLIRPGSRVVVVGAGLGDDVAELASRGYDAVGFDISPTAVEWARRRFPHLSASFLNADLLAAPPRLCRRFDLVVEIYTLQSLEPSLRESAARSVAALACSKGYVLTICRGREAAEPLDAVPGPPWPLTVAELTALMEAAGLRPARPVESFHDDESPPVHRLRALFGR